MNLRLAALILALCITACGDDTPTGSDGSPSVTVMTWNVYIGGDVQTAFTNLDNPLLLPAEVAAFWANVNASDFPARAHSIATIIAREQPHLVGLQEVSRFLTQSPGDFLAGNPVQAQDVALDFLDELLSALSELGQNYTVAASVDNSDIEFISITADDIRQIDREVILARSDVTITDSQTGHYTHRVSVPLPGGNSIDIPRGWTLVDAVIEQNAIRFISTHLEVRAYHDIQINQAEELAQRLPPTSLPTILVGDINSTAIRSVPTTYATIVDGGYTDTWMELTGEPGPTCCQSDDLMNEYSTLSGRIDKIFHKGDFTPLSASVVGNQIEDRTPSGVWPSDHAGVVATLSLP
jgi:endonuclease/exonuclease/phosphatase family metal-dependent hydrolase